MDWTAKTWRIGRVIVLALLLLSLLGPWEVEEIRFPTAEFPCVPSSIVLEDGACGKPFSGIVFLILAIVQIPGFFVVMLLGGVGLRDLLYFLPRLALLVPLISAAFLLADDRSSRVGFHAAAVLVSLSLILLSGMFSYAQQTLAVWGPWLYIAVGIVSVVLEGLRLWAASRRGSALLTA
jgi:hypothetical protein